MNFGFKKDQNQFEKSDQNPFAKTTNKAMKYNAVSFHYF